MDIGRVIGNVVSTNKDVSLTGQKLLVVQVYNIVTMKPTDKCVVASDVVGAGEKEIVLLVSGSSARLTELTEKKPVDMAVIGIVDQIEVEHTRIFDKREEA